MNRSTMMAVAKTEASAELAAAAADKLVVMTRGWQTGTDNNQLRQWRACCGVGGAAVAQQPHGSIVGARGGHLACCGVGGVAAGCWWR
jgi:hypothetical protein